MMKKMKIIISQPMKCKTNKEIMEERKEVVEELQKQGYEIIDTVFDIQNGTPLQYLAKSIEMIDKVDGVVFMAGWEKTRGRRAEYMIAKEYGKFIKILS